MASIAKINVNGYDEGEKGLKKDFDMKDSITKTMINRYFLYIDIASIFLAFRISYILLPYLIPYLSPFPEGILPSIRHFDLVLVIFAPICFILLKLEGAYEKLTGWSYLMILGKMTKITILSLAFSAMIMFLIKETGVSRLFMALMSFCFFILLSFSRIIALLIMNKKEARGDFTEKVILIGDGVSVSKCLTNILPKEREMLIEAVGYVSTDKTKNEIDLPQLGLLEDLKNLLNNMPISQAILILTKQNSDSLPKILAICEQTGTTLRVINEYLFHKEAKSKYIWRNDFFADLPSMYATEVTWSTEKEVAKRVFDLFFSGVTILLLSPMLFLIALMIKLSSRGPVLYKRQLVGQHGKPFVALKFRSMTENAHELLETDAKLRAEYQESLKIKNDPRVTKFGRFLRKTSLDELPQFINVFKGEMSVVGPRMLGDIEWEKYGDVKAKVISVRPGITGLWQIHGRHEVTFEERIEYDLRYINNHNPVMDLAIILKTILVVFKMQGKH